LFAKNKEKRGGFMCYFIATEESNGEFKSYFRVDEEKDVNQIYSRFLEIQYKSDLIIKLLDEHYNILQLQLVKPKIT
jgi:hypothetical protein